MKVYVLWDSTDYYGPDEPVGVPFVYATKKAALAARKVLADREGGDYANRPEVFFPIVEEEVAE